MTVVVVAPDKFRGSLSAPAVAAAIANGIRRRDTSAIVREAPLADGGEGTVAAAIAAGWQPHPITVTGPLGATVTATYATSGDRAIIELASASGLALLSTPQPMRATTFGVGQLIADAVARGSRDLILGLGGSASTDGGAGMLAALGARLLDSHGSPIFAAEGRATARPALRGVAALASVTEVDLSEVAEHFPDVQLTLAADVDNPLLGSRGAAAVFAPQKGANVDQVRELEEALTAWADTITMAVGSDHRERRGAGAAGGTGFAALAVLGATVRAGAEVVMELIGFSDALRGADLVITGEGRLDSQTLGGKVPVAVARAAAAHGIPTVAIVGKCELNRESWSRAGFADVLELAAIEPDPIRSHRDAAALLEQLGQAAFSAHK